MWDPDVWDGWQEGSAWQYLWFVPQEHAEAASAILATRVRLVAPRLLRLEAASPLGKASP